MSPQTIFQMHLVLGYLACLLCFGVHGPPRPKRWNGLTHNASSPPSQLPLLRARPPSSWSRRPNCLPASRPSPPTATLPPASLPSWLFSR